MQLHFLPLLLGQIYTLLNDTADDCHINERGWDINFMEVIYLSYAEHVVYVFETHLFIIISLCTLKE
jgi:hypothetical protein